MTLYLWDASHYDGLISVDTFKRARAEGIVAFTHKISEGVSYVDPLGIQNLTNARDAGFELIGGYHVVRSSDVGGQVDNAMRSAPPWWRDFPGWFGQIDLELWDYDKVPAATGIDFGHAWRDAMARTVVMYASRGQYGDQLTPWDGEFWNADYPSSRQAPFKDMYPGDGYKGWAPYSGKTPALLQYASTATIAGLTTCDANAFRGTLEQLRALLSGADMSDRYSMNSDQYLYETANEHDPISNIQFPDGTTGSVPNLPLRRAIQVEKKLDELAADVDALHTAVAALAAGPSAKDIVDELLSRFSVKPTV